MSEARGHHYVPACYLRAFANPADRTGRLMVFDRTSGRSWASSPNGAAKMHDFYRVDVPGNELAAEDALSKLESVFAPTLAAINLTGARPGPSEIRKMLAFIAIQQARTPMRRAWFDRGFSDITMLALRVSTADRAAFPAIARNILPDATDEDVDETYQAVTEFLAARGARVAMDRTTLVRAALELAPTLEDILAARTWVLGIAPIGAAFITSDEPVLLEWAGPGHPPAHWTPAPGRPDTVVTVPLGPRYIAIGLPTAQTRARFRLSVEDVARCNFRTVMNASQYVYYGGDGFTFADPDGGPVLAGPGDLRLRREASGPASKG